MDIKPDRMVYLGYGKYWRSDAIVGLMPIETERGPGRRTEVYTATLDHPIVASRSETAILQDMAIATDEALRVQDNEARLDVDAWLRRLRELLRTAVPEPVEQNDLFQP
ncbi:MAG: hypothetical protein HYW52_01915 [Gemmatimonadetes bacterium]|nr:hypothetical protein [Gemmatimonadota bacterium]